MTNIRKKIEINTEELIEQIKWGVDKAINLYALEDANWKNYVDYATYKKRIIFSYGIVDNSDETFDNAYREFIAESGYDKLYEYSDIEEYIDKNKILILG